MTSGERWQRVGALFNRAVAAPEAERLSVVRASGETPDIQDEVIDLLQSHDDSGGFLEPPALLDPGVTVGAYRIERILGRGGMGVVYLATDTRLQRLVALKSLPPHLFRDEQMRARLRREARAAAALSHAGIATVYALEEIGEHIFIATEYLEGQTLRDELRGGPMTESRVLDIARAIAAALTTAHDRGIVHRDLKPENVMLTSGGVKIVDFGLAQLDVAAEDLASVTRLTDVGVMAGTPPYMAPEQLLGQATDARTDQFAFGVMLYEMLTGRHPFASGRLPSAIAKTLAANPERANVSERLWAVIDRATQKAPSDRFTSMRDLAQAFDPGTMSAAVPAGTAGVGLSWWSRHQLIVALAYWFMVWPTWHVHPWTGRYGVLTFLATLAVVVIGANTRLHLWFSARTYPHQLATQRSSIRLLVRVADVVFAVQMVAIGLTIAAEHTGWSALFISFGLGAVVAFLVIEPATERAAFESRPQ